MTTPDELRAVWERVNAVQRERWQEHVDGHLPSRLLETLTDGPGEVPAD